MDGFVGGMSIEQNITLASLKAITEYGMIKALKEKKAALRYFEELKVKAPDMDVHLNTLSGGNQQKVVLSKWLMTNPKVLILDEPTRGIDVGTKYEIYKIMVDLARQGMAIIMINSDMEELLGMSDRILIIRQGRVAGELSREEATPGTVMSMAVGGNGE